MTARRVLPLLAATLLLGTPAAAQRADQSSVVLSIFAGVQTGSDLWSIGRQPICVLDASSQCTSMLDTLRLSRQTGSTLAAGVAALYFPRPYWGVHAQLAYQGFPLDDGCEGLFYHPDTDNPVPAAGPRNQQVCQSIAQSSVPGGSMSGILGLVLRVPTETGISPFVRGGLGIVSRPQSSLDMSGDYLRIAQPGDDTIPTRRVVIFDDSPRRTWVAFYLGAGFSVPLGPGYQFRLELRDLISGVERPDGPSVGAGQVPTATKLTHHLALTLGLDIVLERRRGRRY